MKNIYVAILCILIASTYSCKKDASLNLDDQEYQAIISGYVLEDLLCESGYVVNLITDPPTLMPMYALTMPDDSEISPYSLFPINVAIQWERDTTACYNNYIKITKIRIVK